MWQSGLFLVLCVLWQVNGDVYLHIPRGSNNRLDGQNRERRNNNRMFDSQNNNRGGYNVGGDNDRSSKIRGKKTPEQEDEIPGRMAYYEGSTMQISWTNQHQCSGQNDNCELIIQYMCDKDLRDGATTRTIQETNSDGKREFGMNENSAYYKNCKDRTRNVNLFTADQKLKGNSAKYTRQNPNGQRSGLECPEERDYYPYWQPTPWIDVAVMTNTESRCAKYKRESENNSPRWFCRRQTANNGATQNANTGATQNANTRATQNANNANNANNGATTTTTTTTTTAPATSWGRRRRRRRRRTRRRATRSADAASSRRRRRRRRAVRTNKASDAKLIPITETECKAVKAVKMEWVQDTRRKPLAAPECRLSPRSRDNHNGNGPDGFPNAYNWTLPNLPHKHCVLRIRYNISSREYDWSANAALNATKNANSKLDIAAVIGEPKTEAQKRGYIFKNNPEVTPVKLNSGKKLELRLAINTAQVGRTFEDRSHSFQIKPRPTQLKDKKIYNMEVQGKRGNIVQVYPAVEYDYGPNRLEVGKDEYVHIQWTGSDRNPNNNDGNGRQRTDRSNMVLLKGQNYPEGEPGKAVPIKEKYGQWGNSYPAHLKYDPKKLLGLPITDTTYLALTVSNAAVRGKNLKELDDAHPYFNLEPRQLSTIGTYHYMCTRNNDFSNRSHKGKIMVVGKGQKENRRS